MSFWLSQTLWQSISFTISWLKLLFLQLSSYFFKLTLLICFVYVHVNVYILEEKRGKIQIHKEQNLPIHSWWKIIFQTKSWLHVYSSYGRSPSSLNSFQFSEKREWLSFSDYLFRYTAVHSMENYYNWNTYIHAIMPKKQKNKSFCFFVFLAW